MAPSQALQRGRDQDGVQRQTINRREMTLGDVIIMFKNHAATALACLFALGLAGPAFAATSGGTQEQMALQGTNLTLAQAIATAEQQTGGKAFDAGVDVGHGRPRVVVETNGPKGVQTVIVDAQNGQIVGGHPGGEAD
ncbi:MAG TPA: PepSY domain-containing protein [Acetobacteraceae bacterium]|nr:PepSY domain-containing protein [Acetobacteraceae bacterium]